MAINKNHEFEELNGVKCGIVEKNVSPERAAFLKKILETNNFEVIVAATVTKPAAAKPVTAEVAEPIHAPDIPEPSAPLTVTVGVTDYTFNPINAIFGRLLKTAEGQVVTLAYWQQKETISHDDIPYFGNKAG